jgi:Domain of unknown function (DUF6265)
MKAILLILLALPLTAAELPSWMAGTWRSTTGGVRMEEHWTSAEGGLMLGLHRDVSRKKTSFEFIRIERRGDTLVYLAMPGGRPPTEFPLKSATAGRIVFENLAHDFPQRIIYWRERGRLCARVEDASQQGEQWCWTRVRP